MSKYQLFLILVAVCSLGGCGIYGILCLNGLRYARGSLHFLQETELAWDPEHGEPMHSLDGAKGEVDAALWDFKMTIACAATLAISLFLL